MSISQVDMLTLVPRTNEVSQIRHVEMQRPAQEQAQMNTMFPLFCSVHALCVVET